MNGVSEHLREMALDLAWSLWGELGVSAWSRSHGAWSVEVEPLIAFTAQIAEVDRRLLRESIVWCADRSELVSLNQLRHVVTQQGWPFEGPIASYGATVSRLTGRKWPGSADAEPYDVKRSGKSQLRDLRSPALLQLRLRAMLGVSARAEIVRVLVADPRREWGTAEVAERVAYTRRQVAADLEMLALAGVVRKTRPTASFRYALDDVETVLELTAPLPSVTPRWAPLFRLMTGLMDAVDSLESRPLEMPAMELSRQLRWLQPAMDAARIHPPHLAGDEILPGTLEWARDLFSSVARGDPIYLSADSQVRSAGR